MLEIINKFKESLLVIVFSLIGLAGVFGVNFLNNRVNSYPDFIKLLVFVIIMIIINWNSLLGLFKNYKNFDVLTDDEKEIEDEFSIHKGNEALSYACILSFIMLVFVYFLSVIFPDFIHSILYGQEGLKRLTSHHNIGYGLYSFGLGLAIQIIIAANFVSTIYHNYKYR